MTKAKAARFNRLDICQAYLAMEWDWNDGGWLQERPSNVRRGQARGYTGEATSIQLRRIGFDYGRDFDGFPSLSRNGKAIYRELERRYGFAAMDSR